MKTVPYKYENQSSWSTETGRYIEIQRLKPSIYIDSIPILSEIFSAGTPAEKEWNGERSSMAQHAILRFEKHKGNPARPLEAHHERKKEQYASNPDIDTSRSRYNFHIVKPEGRYYHFIQSRIEQSGCRTRKDSTRFVDTLITASPEFFKKKSPEEIQAFFKRAADFLIDRVGRENIVSAIVHMDEKTPHLHLTFVPLTKDNRLCAKEIIGNRANLTKWQDTNTNNVLLSYVNVKIAELDGHKQEFLAKIAELTVEAISPEQVSQISGYLDTWDSVSFDDKRRVVDLMITTVAATSDSLNITWKI